MENNGYNYYYVTMEMLPWSCYHGYVTMEMLPWRYYHGDVTMDILNRNDIILYIIIMETIVQLTYQDCM